MTRKHLIESVSFQQMAEQGRPMSEAPLRCSCGWLGTSGGWEPHRGLTVDGERIERNKAAYRLRQETAA